MSFWKRATQMSPWNETRNKARQLVCRRLKTYFVGKVAMYPDGEALFRQIRDQAYAYYCAADVVLGEMVYSTLAGYKDRFTQLDADGYLRVIAALQSYHVFKLYSDRPNAIYPFMEFICETYALPDSFIVPWSDAFGSDEPMVAISELRGQAICEALGMPQIDMELDFTLYPVEIAAATMTVSLMEDPNWSSKVDQDLASSGA